MDNNELSYLDRIRIKEGADKLLSYYENLLMTDKWEAVNLINDVNLSFAAFYIILPLITKYRLFRYLNHKNMAALGIINQIFLPKGNYQGIDYLSDNRSGREVLKWIFDTGAPDEVEDDDYEQILDVAASVLINTYSETEILIKVRDLIFSRNRRGRYVNDLVWAYFKSKSPEALSLIAEMLKSDDAKDNALTLELLNIDSLYDQSLTNLEKYEAFNNWIAENDPYLYFTEESNQYSSRPVPVKADYERKYINKGFKGYEPQPLKPEDENEEECLAAFKPLDDDEKKALSEYSLKMRSKDFLTWRKWIKSPIDEQIKQMKSQSEEV